MKKTLPVILCFILVFSMFPFSVFAVNESQNSESLVPLACELFPEYADILLSRNSTSPASLTPDNTEPTELLFTKIRAINEYDILSYSQYSDGSVLLAEISSDASDFAHQMTTNSRYATTQGVTCDISIRGEYVGDYSSGAYFRVSNIVYSIGSGVYGVFNSAGTHTEYGDCNYVNRSITSNETATSPAKIVYNFTFRIASPPTQFYSTYLTVLLRNNTLTITFNDDYSA